jgi:hypothetical protein
MHYFTLKSKRSGMEWRHHASPPPKEFKTQLSAGKIVASVSKDSEGVINVDFLPHHVTTHSIIVTCFAMTCTKLFGRKLSKGDRSAVWKRSSIYFMTNLTKVTLATRGWEITNHPSYNPNLTPSDFHSFGPMKVHLEDRNFKLVMNSKAVSVLTWLRSQDRNFKAGDISNLPWQWGGERKNILKGTWSLEILVQIVFV